MSILRGVFRTSSNNVFVTIQSKLKSEKPPFCVHHNLSHQAPATTTMKHPNQFARTPPNPNSRKTRHMPPDFIFTALYSKPGGYSRYREEQSSAHDGYRYCVHTTHKWGFSLHSGLVTTQQGNKEGSNDIDEYSLSRIRSGSRGISYQPW
jgi:hypothetical protein